MWPRLLRSWDKDLSCLLQLTTRRGASQDLARTGSLKYSPGWVKTRTWQDISRSANGDVWVSGWEQEVTYRPVEPRNPKLSVYNQCATL